MRRLFGAILLVLIAVSAYGFLVHRMRLTTIDEPREYLVVVSDPSANESYYWLYITGCAADHTDEGVVCNVTGWSGSSDRAWTRDRVTGAVKQMPMSFRDAPRGPILRFEAVVRDRAGKAVASASMITMRRR